MARKSVQKIGIVGATGEVGRTIIEVLMNSQIEFDQLKLYGSNKSQGKTIKIRDKDFIVEALNLDSDQRYDAIFFSAGGSISTKYVPWAQKCSEIVIDNSSAFRMDSQVPLVIPEINGNLIENKKYQGIVANPNCSTIQMLLALNKIEKFLSIAQIVVSTYQSVSGAGKKGLLELELERRDSDYPNQIFQDKIFGNVIPEIGPIDSDSNFTQEESKMINETKKIFKRSDIKVEPTAVRVPVSYGHSESIYFRTKKSSSLEEIKELIASSPNVELAPNLLTPLNCYGSDVTYVSRLRQSSPHEFLMWVVADNVRVGAATNAVRILEKYLGV